MFPLYMEDSVSLCRKQQANFEIRYASLILGFYKIQRHRTEEAARCLPCKHKDLSLVTQNPIKEPVVATLSLVMQNPIKKPVLVPHACHISTLKVEKGGSLGLLDDSLE